LLRFIPIFQRGGAAIDLDQGKAPELGGQSLGSPVSTRCSLFLPLQDIITEATATDRKQ
jgi:hypothetical protein